MLTHTLPIVGNESGVFFERVLEVKSTLNIKHNNAQEQRISPLGSVLDSAWPKEGFILMR